MARITKKPERERFKLEVVKLIVDHGGIATDEEKGEYRMNTKAGPQSLHVCLDDHGIKQNSPCCVFTRFDFSFVAASLCGAAEISGKFNFHFSAGVTCDTAINEIKCHFESMKATTLDEFMDQTSIVPQAVVTTILEEQGATPDYRTRNHHRMIDPAYMHDQGHHDYKAAVAWFTAHCEQRLVQLWDINPSIRQKLSSETGRDIAHAFVSHWLCAYLDSPPKYRKAHQNWKLAYDYKSMAA